MKYESLHSHTNISDGKQTHLEVLKTAAEYGFGVVSLTDHDALPDETVARQLESYKGPVNWQIGVEVSSGWPKELGGGVAAMFHILGLRIDPNDPGLREHCNKASEARVERFEATITRLIQAGFIMDEDHCRAIVGNGNPGAPHVAREFLRHEQNLQKLQQLAQDMSRAAEHDSRFKAAYADMMYRYENSNHDPKYLVFPLLLSENAFVEEIYIPYLYWLDMDETVSRIRNAGGVAVLAHWPTVAKMISLDMLEDFLAAGRLDGLEYRSGFTLALDVVEVGEKLKLLAEKHNKLATIGLDSHDAEAFERFMGIEGLAEQTVGQWQEVLEFKN